MARGLKWAVTENEHMNNLLLRTLCLLLAWVAAWPAAAQTAPRPNIVLIVSDDQGW